MMAALYDVLGGMGTFDWALSMLVVTAAALYLVYRFFPVRRSADKPVAQTPVLKGALAQGVARAEAKAKENARQ